jgi:hypothetical protein
MCALSLRYRGRVAILAVLLASLSGCGGYSFTDVTGQVKYNGKPLDKPNGTISFLGPDGIQHTGQIDASGNYRVEKVCAGENKVTVIYARPQPESGRVRGRVPDPNKPDPTMTQTGPAFLTPDKYASPETTDLIVEVKKGTTYNPELTGPEIK